MKKLVLLISIFLFTGFYSSKENNKFSYNLNFAVNNSLSPSGVFHIWVNLRDKGNNNLSDAENLFTADNKKRRQKLNNEIADFTDIPVNYEYVQLLKNSGFNVKHISKWFNSVSGYATYDVMKNLAELDFVKSIELVSKYRYNENYKKLLNSTEGFENIQSDNSSSYSLNYGGSLAQSEMINVPICHDSGYKGQGVLIASFDTGVDNLMHPCFDSMRVRGIRTYDFVNNDTIIGNIPGHEGDGCHGTRTLSLVAGFAPGNLISPAFQSRYIIAKTENTKSETPVEEDNWIAAAEWADSLGADIITSSLGYLDFDPGSPYQYNWTWMNGDSCRITIAADLAVNKGIIVVNSAGNNGFNASHNTLNAPADGDSVLTIGSINFNGARSSFSSVGLTTDGRIKPDVMAVGSGNTTAVCGSGTGYTNNGSGTSFSCPMVAGSCAIILSANPSLTPMQVVGLLKSTASNTSNPNREIGWGTIDTWEAVKIARSLSVINPENTFAGDYKLDQNYPNPFNPQTQIPLVLKKPAFVTIRIYDETGRSVADVLNNKAYPDGSFTVSFNSSSYNLSAGVYYYSLIVNGLFISSKKMVLVK
ncbi:MAG TPA: hypothetical protein DEP28_03605 [Bacteroidetes bacterium]|nr:hypothetical protein [Bacteroidota bacterium]HCN37499.1 hypothetical protein [Bacteroidota bacterium]